MSHTDGNIHSSIESQGGANASTAGGGGGEVHTAGDGSNSKAPLPREAATTKTAPALPRNALQLVNQQPTFECQVRGLHCIYHEVLALLTITTPAWHSCALMTRFHSAMATH